MTEIAPGGMDLLSDKLIHIRDAGGATRGESIPGLLAAMGSGEEVECTGLRAHQQHAWHSFLVQLAAIALHRAGETGVKQSAERWRAWLVALSDGNPRAWWLVNETLKEPAFMQPPVPEGTLDGFGDEDRVAPDEEDVLFAAKNHDVKMQRMLRPHAEHWVFALVSMQTMGAFGGRSWYSIARMNGGSSSRPALGAAPGMTAATRWRRDVEQLLATRAETLVRYPYFATDGGLALLWIVPWDGKKSLGLGALDPFFIEVCRRLRLHRRGEHLGLRAIGTEGARVAAKDIKGNTGDSWTPVKLPEGKALTASARTFHYAKLQELLFSSEFRQPVAQSVTARDGAAPWFVGQVLVGGNCVTDGYRERWLPLPPAVRRRLLAAQGTQSLGEEASARVETADIVKRKVLRPAILTALQGAPEKRKNDDPSANRWLDALDSRIDAEFFAHLWSAIDAIDDGTDDGERDRQRTAWTHWLLKEAEQELEKALHAAAMPSARRLKAIAAAESLFHAAARRNFPSAFTQVVRDAAQSEEQSR